MPACSFTAIRLPPPRCGSSAIYTSAPTPRFGSSPRGDSRGRNDTPGPVYEYRDSLGGQVVSGKTTAAVAVFGTQPRFVTKHEETPAPTSYSVSVDFGSNPMLSTRSATPSYTMRAR